MPALTTVRVFYDRPEAVAAAAMLDAHGVYAVLPDWFHSANAWHLTVALQGIRLQVLDDDASDAAELLKGVADYQPPPTEFSAGRGIIALLCWYVAAVPYPVRRRRGGADEN